MRELVLCVVAFFLFHDHMGIAVTAAPLAVGVMWTPTYLLSCMWKPWWICPRSTCSAKKPFAVDERGHVRAKFPCWFCWGRGPRLRRPGSILIGRGRT